MTVELATTAHGERGTPLVILHGLLGSARNWTTIAKRLGETYRVFALDLRNHGTSPWAPTMTYDDMAEDVRAFIEDNALDPAILLGHSMGGKVAMRLALLYHDLVDRMIVADIAPAAYHQSYDEFIDAMRAVPLGHMMRRGEVDQALQPAVPDPGMRAFLMQNLARQDEGFSWRPNLDAIAMNMDDLLGWPDPLGATFDGPTLFIAGANSDYLPRSSRPKIEAIFPDARFATIQDAGHWVHAEKPAEFLQIAGRFLEATSL
jgi:pimeloyl-ACP methyl ester carboxylesterase